MTHSEIAANVPATMRGLVQRSTRGPDDMVLVRDLAMPSPGPQEYLIKVGSAGLNFADVMQARGIYAGGPVPEYVAGFEAAGEIVGVGSGIADPLSIGTHVVGTGPGAFAQYMAMPAVTVAPVPSGWSDAAALGLILNWVTAMAAIKQLGNLVRGEWVLIHAAAGGVGQAAVRSARHYGAKVIAITSKQKHDAVVNLGADVVLDRDSDELEAEILRASGGGVDLVLESIGAATFRTSLSVTKPFTGRVVVFGAASGDYAINTHNLVFEHRVQLKGLHIGALAESVPHLYDDLLDETAVLIAAGVYPPGEPEVHALVDGPAAMRSLANGETVGKLAVDPWS